VVPVIKDADKKGIFQISQEMGELAKKARDGKLGPGRHERRAASPSRQLGRHRRRATSRPSSTRRKSPSWACRQEPMEPVWDGKAFQPRLMLPCR